eukprot:1871163-Rhodomonas_salina.1
MREKLLSCANGTICSQIALDFALHNSAVSRQKMKRVGIPSKTIRMIAKRKTVLWCHKRLVAPYSA